MTKINKLPITVIVPVRNEQENLPAMLPLLKDFDEVIIVDSQSTDRTVEIAESFGCPVHQFVWNGHFPKKRNWTLRNIPMRNDWVFFVDADEYMTDEFIAELRRVFDQQNESIVGYWINYYTYFLRKKMKHSGFAKKLALFKRSAGEYEKIEDESTEGNYAGLEIHEHPILDGQVGEIKSKIEHREDKGISHYIKKHNEYSSWEVRRYLKLIKTPKRTLTFVQKVKYSLINTWFLGDIYFIYLYFVKLGFLDGKRGYIFASLKREYFFNIKCKLEETKLLNIK